MARQKRHNTTWFSLLRVLFLVARFIFIKVGQLPFLIFRWSIKIIAALAKLGSPHLHRQRGRPPKPLTLPLLIKKLKARYKAIPKTYQVALILVIFLTIFFYYTFLIFQAAYELPNPSHLSSLDKPLTTEFYDRHGNLLYRAYEGKNRTLVTLQELPPHVAQATISIEDKNFYHHLGLDPVAILRAAYHNLRDNKLEGASTLTQQLIKNTLLTPEKTLSRKIKEMILAFWAERIYPKDQILTMYLNEAPYGGTIWGIEAAAQTYFNKPAQDLSLAEAAYLAGLPASPTQFSPYGPTPELAKERQLQVLRSMQENNYLTKAEEQHAAQAPLNINPPTSHIAAPHFVMYLRDLLSQKYGARVVSQGGLKIYTTLDLGIQEQTEQIVATEIEQLGALNVQNGAAMVLDAKTGQILAMVGSRGYGYPGIGNFNVALALRQPGSAVKVLTYAAAFKKGYSPGNTVLDTPVSFKDQWGNNYSPVNYDGTFRGAVSIRTALGSSLNIPAVKMLATVGVDSFIQTGRDLGITSFSEPNRYGLSITLGGAEVRMIEMMGVYNTLSQMGKLRQPTGILKVVDAAGNTLEQYRDLNKQVLQEEVAYLITHILADNKARTPAFGSNSLLHIPGHEVAVKTGTSDNKRDNWTFGYTPDYVVGVWVGNNNNSPMNPRLASGITGAAPIWNKIIHSLVDNHPPSHFKRPPGIAEVKIEGRPDLAIVGNIPKSLITTKASENKTIFSDAFSVYATSSAQTAPN